MSPRLCGLLPGFCNVLEGCMRRAKGRCLRVPAGTEPRRTGRGASSPGKGRPKDCWVCLWWGHLARGQRPRTHREARWRCTWAEGGEHRCLMACLSSTVASSCHHCSKTALFLVWGHAENTTEQGVARQDEKMESQGCARVHVCGKSRYTLLRLHAARLHNGWISLAPSRAQEVLLRGPSPCSCGKVGAEL